MITIVLADDHKIVRQGIRALLESEPDLVLLGEASDGLEALQISEHLKPDVLVLDLMMPGLRGLETIWQVRQRVAKTRIVVLSMHDNEAYVLEALKNGASGYVLKDASAAELVFAIREVAAGRRYLAPPFSDRAIESYIEKAHGAIQDPFDTLTPREREVFNLAAQGSSNSEIAARLSISPRTVEIHRANLLRKLGLRSQADLARYAIQHGVLPME
jgi:two-component system response regulator NreC